jgi:hypothetical protein
MKANFGVRIISPSHQKEKMVSCKRIGRSWKPLSHYNPNIVPSPTSIIEIIK